MTYKLTIEPKPTYLHALVTGENTRENVAGYLQELLLECAARNCYRVLIEERLEGPRLGTIEVFELAARGSSQTMGRMEAVAYVDVNADGDTMEFAGTVASNRGVPVTVFPTVAEAEEWLLGKAGEKA
jgi:hypothetical protein